MFTLKVGKGHCLQFFDKMRERVWVYIKISECNVSASSFSYKQRIDKMKKNMRKYPGLCKILNYSWFKEIEKKVVQSKDDVDLEYILPYTFRAIENNRLLKLLENGIELIASICSHDVPAKKEFEKAKIGLKSFNFSNNRGSVFEIIILAILAKKDKHIKLYPLIENKKENKKRSDAKTVINGREFNIEITHIGTGEFKSKVDKIEKEIKKYISSILPEGFRCSIVLNEEKFKFNGINLNSEETSGKINKILKSQSVIKFLSHKKKKQIFFEDDIIVKIEKHAISFRGRIIDIQYKAIPGDIPAMRKEIQRKIINDEKLKQLDGTMPNLLFIALGSHADESITKFELEEIFERVRELSAVILFDSMFKYLRIISKKFRNFEDEQIFQLKPEDIFFLENIFNVTKGDV